MYKSGLQKEENFQSTPPRRRRQKVDSEELDSVTFSIHASAKEATLQMNRFPRLSNFQSTPPRRRRPVMRDSRIVFSVFQSTPPRRRRPSFNCLYYSIFLFFNPRLREGGDTQYQTLVLPFLLFNPRLREGGDPLFLLVCNILLRFQSTPPRRRRPQHIVIPQLSCAYLVSTTFLSTIFSFISQYIVLFPLFRVRMPCVFCVAYDSHYVPLFNIFYILFQGTPF